MNSILRVSILGAIVLSHMLAGMEFPTGNKEVVVTLALLNKTKEEYGCQDNGTYNEIRIKEAEITKEKCTKLQSDGFNRTLIRVISEERYYVFIPTRLELPEDEVSHLGCGRVFHQNHYDLKNQDYQYEDFEREGKKYYRYTKN